MAAAFAFTAAIAFMLAPVLRSPSPGPGGPGGAGVLPSTAPNTPTGQTAREVADLWFDEVMASAEAGDSPAVDSLVPVAIQSYLDARPLDADGLFHLSTLQRAAARVEDARESALQALVTDPDHLLGLYAAARAADAADDSDAAAGYYSRILSVWSGEMEAQRPEYEAHRDLMPVVRSRAERFLAAG